MGNAISKDQKDQYVLGINWEQNSTASLFLNGTLLGCISEERLSRVKNDERYPKQAIDFLLKEYAVNLKDIVAVCFVSNAWAPGYILTRHYTKLTTEDYITEQKNIWYPRLFEGKTDVSQLSVFWEKIDRDQFPGPVFWDGVIKSLEGTSAHASDASQIEFGKEVRRQVIREHLDLDVSKVHFLDHSLCHAAYAFYATCQDEKPRLVLTLDAFGDYINYSARVMQRRRLGSGEIIVDESMLTSGGNLIVGRLYRYVTLLLGLKPNEHEYKVMGLAPYCKPKYYEELLNKFRRLQRVNGIKFEDVEKPRDLYFSIKELIDGQRFDSISGALQAYTEELIVGWIKNCIDVSGVGDICVAGGIAMNVKANMLISELEGVTSVSIPPSPDDSSQAMGAVYAYYHLENKNKKVATSIQPLLTPYLGRLPLSSVSKEQIDLIKLRLEAEGYCIEEDNFLSKAVSLLQEGKVLGRIVGREEFGARALGNRSILADPRNAAIKKIINEKIKDRDFWMPFACSVTVEHAEEYLQLEAPSRCYSYMTLCCNSLIKNELNNISAAVHPYDETCRPHLLFKDANPEYYKLISAFGDATGTYALLNTSLNLHGFPIASTMDDAIEILFASDLDGLLTENFLVMKSRN